MCYIQFISRCIKFYENLRYWKLFTFIYYFCSLGINQRILKEVVFYWCSCVPLIRFVYPSLLLSAERLRDVFITVSNISPETQAPTLSGATNCGSYAGPFTDGETRSISCGKSGRYISVILDTTERLTLCEVQVFGSKCHCKIRCLQFFTL